MYPGIVYKNAYYARKLLYYTNPAGEWQKLNYVGTTDGIKSVMMMKKMPR